MSALAIIRVPKVWRLCGIPHNRHTAAALSLAADRNLHVVMVRLGHKDIRTTINVYGHLLPSVDVAHADKLAAMWDATSPQGQIQGQEK
jgi:integrase